MSGLKGRAVVVTRAAQQAAELEFPLRARGARPLTYPCIEIASPENPTPLDDALTAAASGAFNWLVLTSANTVVMLEQRLRDIGLPPDALSGINAAAVGPATAAEAEARLRVRVGLIPDSVVGSALASALGAGVDAKILLPQSALADNTLAEQLRAGGADVRLVQAYRTIIGSGGVDLGMLLARGEVDAITFTSGSTVVNCLTRLRAEADISELPAEVVVACIGSKTAATAREMGLEVRVMSTDHSLEGLVSALDAYFSTIGTGVRHDADR